MVSRPTSVEDTAHQQGVDHALRRARGPVDKHQGAGKIFPRQVIGLFTEALHMRDHFAVEGADAERRGQAYESFTDRLCALTERPLQNEANARFARHLNRHAAN